MFEGFYLRGDAEKQAAQPQVLATRTKSLKTFRRFLKCVVCRSWPMSAVWTIPVCSACKINAKWRLRAENTWMLWGEKAHVCPAANSSNAAEIMDVCIYLWPTSHQEWKKVRNFTPSKKKKSVESSSSRFIHLYQTTRVVNRVALSNS